MRLSISGEFILAHKSSGSIIGRCGYPPPRLVGRRGQRRRGADHFLATLGEKLIADGLPLAGGALTLTAAHPIIARRTWLWRAETGMVIEALGFGSIASSQPGGGSGRGHVGRDWLAALGAGPVQDDAPGVTADSPALA
jgi:adenylate cyclase